MELQMQVHCDCNKKKVEEWKDKKKSTYKNQSGKSGLWVYFESLLHQFYQYYTASTSVWLSKYGPTSFFLLLGKNENETLNYCVIEMLSLSGCFDSYL